MYESPGFRRFMRMICKTLLVSFAFTASLHAVPVFIGTNTGGKSESKGIYLADFDEATGKLSAPVLAAEYKNPGFLALHPSKPVLYACGQPKADLPDGANSVAAFAIGQGNKLEFLGESSSGGKGACHVAVDGSGSTVAVANYGDGSFSTIRLKENGAPGEIATVITSEGKGPNPRRQERAHAHGVYFDKANEHFFMPDLGIDKVLVHSFDAKTSKLGDALAPLETVPGAGPRHMTFSPDEKHAYVINELDNTILTASYQDGKFKVLGTVPTLPSDFEGGSTTSEIEVHPSGKFVYGSNRGHDSIAVYRRDEKTGALTFLQHAPCGGKTPRHFKIDPSGKWLLCAHQDSNTISMLAIDPEKGTLGEPSNTVATPSPICVVFPK